jgi:hypothetical protein
VNGEDKPRFVGWDGEVYDLESMEDLRRFTIAFGKLIYPEASEEFCLSESALAGRWGDE